VGLWAGGETGGFFFVVATLALALAVLGEASWLVRLGRRAVAADTRGKRARGVAMLGAGAVLAVLAVLNIYLALFGEAGDGGLLLLTGAAAVACWWWAGGASADELSWPAARTDRREP
jgi:hypothetical protein